MSTVSQINWVVFIITESMMCCFVVSVTLFISMKLNTENQEGCLDEDDREDKDT